MYFLALHCLGCTPLRMNFSRVFLEWKCLWLWWNYSNCVTWVSEEYRCHVSAWQAASVPAPGTSGRGCLPAAGSVCRRSQCCRMGHEVKASPYSGVCSVGLANSLGAAFVENIYLLLGFNQFSPLIFFSNKIENISWRFACINLSLIQMVSYESVVLSFLLPL